MPAQSGDQVTSAIRGTLADRPLAIILTVAGERSMTGTLELDGPDGRSIVCLRDGAIALVRTATPVAYLGTVLYEEGLLDPATLNETLQMVAVTRRLHGDILLERGIITVPELHDALIEQTCRQMTHLFLLPPETSWTFRQATPDLDEARDWDRPVVDVLRATWRGLRERPPSPHQHRTLAKLEGPMQLTEDGADLLWRYGFTPDELAFATRLVSEPMTMLDAVRSSGLTHARAKAVLYALALGRVLTKGRAAIVGPVDLGIAGIRARAAAIEHEDPHTVLGIPQGASAEAARAVYMRLARAWRADRIPPELDSVRAECQRIRACLDRAHEALVDRRLRHTPVVKAPVAKPPPVTASASRSGEMSAPSMRDVDRAMARGAYDEAATLARELTIAGTFGPSARAVLAWCESKGGLANREILERTHATLERLLSGDPDCVRALYYRGLIAKRLGNDALAIKDFRKVARLDPSHVDAAREVRLFEMRSGDAPAARESSSGLRALFARVANR